MYKTKYSFNKLNILANSWMSMPVLMLIYSLVAKEKNIGTFLAIGIVPILGIVIYVCLFFFPIILKEKGYVTMGYEYEVNGDFSKQFYLDPERKRRAKKTQHRYVINNVVYEKIK